MLPEDCSDARVHWSRVRASMLYSLDASLSVCGAGNRPHLWNEQKLEACWLLRTFLLAYQHLASLALRERRLLYKLRPKLHYTDHLERETYFSGLNPMQVANFEDESFMGHMKHTVAATHPRSQLRTWSKRYVAKRTFAWARMQPKSGSQSS